MKLITLFLITIVFKTIICADPLPIVCLKTITNQERVNNTCKDFEGHVIGYKGPMCLVKAKCLNTKCNYLKEYTEIKFLPNDTPIVTVCNGIFYTRECSYKSDVSPTKQECFYNYFKKLNG